MGKINKLKVILKKEKLDGYIIPKNDEFFGEYIAEYKDRLKYISDFTGSYGFALILNKINYLFVDGRYTLQASKQSEKFFKIKTIPHTLPKNILKNKKLKIAFDPKLLTKKFLNYFFGKTNCKYISLNKNLIDKIWIRKKKSDKNKFYILPQKSVGESYTSKIKKIALKLNELKVDFQFITASENNAWLLNIRGNDSKYTPIPFSYILIDKKQNVKFFCDLKKISLSFKNKFKKIKFIDINNAQIILSNIYKKKFITDKNTCSVYYENIILKNNKIVDQQDPIYSLKAIKAKKEIANIKKAHIYDGAALTKYLFWLKNNFEKKKLLKLVQKKSCLI